MAARSPRLTDFEKRAALIRKQIQAAVAASGKWDEGQRPEEQPGGVLRVECYRYYRLLKKKGLLQQLSDYLLERDEGKWHRHPGQGADWVLRLLEQPGKAWLTAPRRGRIASEFEIADALGISSRWLLAFLYEAGRHELLLEMSKAKKMPAWVAKYQVASKRTSKASAAAKPGEN